MAAEIDFGSKNEQNVYIVLTEMKMDFSYQYPLDGGRRVRGGQVIDFIIWLPPKPIALYVQGERWHSGRFALEDRLKQQAAERHGFTVMEISEAETMTVEAAREALQAML